jgi:hypothetical protein
MEREGRFSERKAVKKRRHKLTSDVRLTSELPTCRENSKHFNKE